MGYFNLSVHSLPIPAQSTETETEKEFETYYLHGTKIDQTVCWIGPVCRPGEILASDTLRIAFTVQLIRHEEDGEEAIQFYGLEGANAGWDDDKVFIPVCSTPNDCATTAINGTEFEIDWGASGGRYIGTGTLDEGTLTLHTTYFDRGIEHQYEITGTRIDLDS